MVHKHQESNEGEKQGVKPGVDHSTVQDIAAHTWTKAEMSALNSHQSNEQGGDKPPTNVAALKAAYKEDPKAHVTELAKMNEEIAAAIKSGDRDALMALHKKTQEQIGNVMALMEYNTKALPKHQGQDNDLQIVGV
jgi:hypothetical protein